MRALGCTWGILLSVGCLQATDAGSQLGRSNGASTGIASNSASSGGNGGASSGGSTGAGSSTGSGACNYPAPAAGGFPYATLGTGWLDLNGALDSAATIRTEPDLLLQLHCSGQSYVLIDVSAAWVPASQIFAQSAPGDTTGWLAQGGLVLTILEQDANQAPVTEQELITWATQYQINYSLVNDPPESLIAALGIKAWPSFYIVRLSDMQIVETQQADVDTLAQTYTALLNGM